MEDLRQILSRGVELHRGGRLNEAEPLYLQVLKQKPDQFEAQHFLAVLRLQQGRFEEAASAFDRALLARPDHSEALYLRANALTALGRYAEAIQSYDKAIAAPGFADAGAHHGRGIALHALGRFEDALESYRAALALDPNNSETIYNSGGAAQQLGRHEEALASFARALALKPDDRQAHYALGTSLHAVNRCRESVASYERALALEGDDPATRLALCVAELPILYESEAEIGERRAAYERRLSAFAAEVAAMPQPGRLAPGVGQWQPFYLAYQGRNDRELQMLYGKAICRITAGAYPPAELPRPPAPGEPVRVGFVSGFFRAHANWRIPTKGWVSRLDRSRFRLFGYHTGAETDAETGVARALCERFVQGPLSIARWREEIAADAPHVLIFPEVGMSADCAKLAAQRLAPVQCTSWGHPETSGYPTLDCFLSSDLMEPGDAQAHYSERLVRLPNLSVYCDPIEKPALSLGREALGMRTSAFVYWCGQSLFKYLPQYDELLPRIARGAGDCQFVFVEYAGSARVTELFRARLERAFAACGLRAGDHCLILPRLDQERFIAATGLADAFLDSIGWSGCNSTLEAVAYDLPIVTLRGDLMRGRHSAAILDMMGVTETIAGTVDHYVDIAIRLARDPVWRADISASVRARSHLIYRDESCIAALEAFLDRAGRSAKVVS